MIDEKTFIKVISFHEKACTYLDNLSNLYIDLYDTPVNFALDMYLREFTETYFTEEGIDTIYWYLFERDGIFCEDSINTPEELWNEVFKFRK